MKVEFELNLMGIVYLVLTVGLVASAVIGLLEALSMTHYQTTKGWLGWLMFSAALTGGLIAVGLLVPVVKRLVRAFTG
jgi:hypothetical protein